MIITEWCCYSYLKLKLLNKAEIKSIRLKTSTFLNFYIIKLKMVPGNKEYKYYNKITAHTCEALSVLPIVDS